MAEEKNFERKVKSFLKDQECWTLKTWSNGVQRSGIPDLLVCCNGHFVGVELKATKGKPSELQIHNLKEIEKAGGFGILLYPDRYQSFKRLIQTLNDGFINEEIYKEFKQEVEKWQVCMKSTEQ